MLSLIREIPPWSWWFSGHKACDGHEHIDHAWIMFGIGQRTKTLIHLVGAHANKLLGFSNAKQQEIRLASFANVGQICKPIGPLSIDFAWVHGVVVNGLWGWLHRSQDTSDAAPIANHHKTQFRIALGNILYGKPTWSDLTFDSPQCEATKM